MSVYKAINAVQADLAKIGISKSQENKFDKYKFRGIDDIYNALAPLVAKHGLVILPRCRAPTIEERETQNGGKVFLVRLSVLYVLVSAEDGSETHVDVIGEAMDRGDKAINKAMSSAYKNFAFQTFVIPTEGDNDTENQTHEVAPKHEFRPNPKAIKVGAAIDQYLLANDEQGALGEWQGATAESQEFAMAVWGLLGSSQRRRIKELAAAAREPIEAAT